jgi:23S rRNA (pseudouridine1915-N3)-methyltransferase
MRFRFIWAGRTRDKNWKALQDDYLKRLSRFAPCDLAEARESPKHDTVQIESQRILELVNPKTHAVLLDVNGSSVSSHELAAKIESWQNRGLKEISFIIGGSDGVASAVADRADDRLSLSFLTFPHEMARVVLLEQLYRAFTILRGFPYQK